MLAKEKIKNENSNPILLFFLLSQLSMARVFRSFTVTERSKPEEKSVKTDLHYICTGCQRKDLRLYTNFWEPLKQDVIFCVICIPKISAKNRAELIDSSNSKIHLGRWRPVVPKGDCETMETFTDIHNLPEFSADEKVKRNYRWWTTKKISASC
jgi:hypothetical protein